MNYCQNCGSSLDGSRKFCSACGCAARPDQTTNQPYNSSQGNGPDQDMLNNHGHGQGRNHGHGQGLSHNQSQGPSYNQSHGRDDNHGRYYNQGQSQHPYQNQNQYPNSESIFDQIQNDNTMLMSILAYIFLLIPLLTGAYKTSTAVKFHTNQGILLFLTSVIWAIARLVIAAVLAFISHYGWIFGGLLNLVWIGFAALYIVGIMNAVSNRMKPLPLIGKFTILK